MEESKEFKEFWEEGARSQNPGARRLRRMGESPGARLACEAGVSKG
jgi:hypothetical protein